MDNHHIYNILSIRKLSSVFCLLSSVFFLTANAQVFDFNDNCKNAYKEIFKLKIENGQSILEEEKAANPENLMPYFIENFIDFLTIYISEDETLFNEAEKRKDFRFNKIKQGPKDSPYYLFLQAELHLQWASARLKFGEYLPAFFEVRKAHKLLKENIDRYPDFKPNKKSLGFLTALFGAIPDKYKLGAKIFGMKGDINDGLSMIAETVKDPSFPFREEAAISYTMLQLHLAKNEDLAWEMVNSGEVSLQDNLLNHFVAASVAYHTGANDKLVHLLSNRPKGAEYFPFPFLDFLLGLAKLHQLDPTANQHLHLFLETYNGRTYIKDAHRKLAWYYLIEDDFENYQKHTQLCLKDGTKIIDEDISAFKEAERNLPPNKDLLKARLLFDGGYLKEALQSINMVDVSSFTNEYYNIEYNYRKARINHESGKIDDAITAYKQTIEIGKSKPIYFAANASLKLGKIYEDQKDYAQASKYYKLCLTMRNHEYENSIIAEAKAGLNRIK